MATKKNPPTTKTKLVNAKLSFPEDDLSRVDSFAEYRGIDRDTALLALALKGLGKQAAEQKYQSKKNKGQKAPKAKAQKAAGPKKTKVASKPQKALRPAARTASKPATKTKGAAKSAPVKRPLKRPTAPVAAKAAPKKPVTAPRKPIVARRPRPAAASAPAPVVEQTVDERQVELPIAAEA